MHINYNYKSKSMVRSCALFLVGLCLSLLSWHSIADADRLKPFVLAERSTLAFDDAVVATRQKLATAPFEVVGDFSPYENAHVFVLTSAALQTAAQKSEYGQFGAIARVAVTQADEEVQIAFVNPNYIANAYRMKEELTDIRDALEATLGSAEDFGSKRGLKTKKLRKYHYTFGMEYFDDPYELGSFDSHALALEAVASGLANNTVGLTEVYRLDMGDATLFGVSMKGPREDDKYYDDAFQMSIVDFKELKSAAYLPYEILVLDDRVVAQHMRFRMAVHFPDLSMMGKHSFMTLMPSPKAIEQALKTVVSAD